MMQEFWDIEKVKPMKGILLSFRSFHHKKVVVALFFLFCGLTAPATTHAPSEITLEYDENSQLLTVILTHSVSDPTLHFVFRIDILKNGSLVSSEEYTNQPTSSTFSYTFQIDAKTGDTLEVIASCILGGSITGSINIGGGPSSKVPPNLWLFHAGFMTGGLFLMFVAIFNILQKAPPHAWLTAHKLSGTLGVLLVIIGLLISVYMVSQTGGGHIRVPHAYIGLITLAISFLIPIFGIGALKKRREIPSLRSIHIWMGRIGLILIIVTILFGLFQVGVL
jgi:hypothetical protein